MTSERIFSSLAVLAVIAITVGFFTTHEPEDVSVVSEDGVLTITGLARQTQPLTVTLSDTVQQPLFGTSYVIEPAGIALDEPAVLAFSISTEQSADIDALQVFRLHPSLNMWESVMPVVAHTDEIIAIETSRLGTFAVGSVPNFEPPVFANVYEDLRNLAPVEAVGYETAVGYRLAEQELMRLPRVGERGGCGGAVRVGDGESVSSLERTAQVKIGDELQSLTFVFVTRWFTSSDVGCGVEDALMPAPEYDILEQIEI
ncbi:MAG: hypothetical protein WAZ14_00050 [Patescibacteria group bacterium]